jgi:hypothetical protein
VRDAQLLQVVHVERRVDRPEVQLRQPTRPRTHTHIINIKRRGDTWVPKWPTPTKKTRGRYCYVSRSSIESIPLTFSSTQAGMLSCTSAVERESRGPLRRLITRTPLKTK